MPANPVIYFYHGASPTPQDFSGREARYKRADNSDADLNDPIAIPSSGVNCSYPKYEKIAWLTSPNELIQDLVWFVSPSGENFDPALNWDGMTLYAGFSVSYDQGVAADALAIRIGLDDTIDYTSASPLGVMDGVVIGAGETGVGATQPYIVTQLAVISTALSGLKGRREVFYRYQEI